MLNRRFLGIDKEKEYLEISKKRKLEIEDSYTASLYCSKLKDFNKQSRLILFLANEPESNYNINEKKRTCGEKNRNSHLTFNLL